jgi:hypothetical protein
VAFTRQETAITEALRSVALPRDAREDLVEALVSRLNDRGSFSASMFRAACDGPTTPEPVTSPGIGSPSSDDPYWLGVFAGAVGHVLQHGDAGLLHSTYSDFLKSDLIRGDDAFRRALPSLPSRARQHRYP